MRRKLTPFGLTMRTRGNPRPGVRVLATAVPLVVVLASLSVKAQIRVERENIEVITHLRTQLPPSEGSPVCLTGGTEPIGRVSRVTLLPGHDEYHDGWELVMEINKRDAVGITTNSVVSARSDRNCGDWVTPFLDINVIGAGPPIVYHTELKGEVTYSAEIAYMLPPKPWWQGGQYRGDGNRRDLH